MSKLGNKVDTTLSGAETMARSCRSSLLVSSSVVSRARQESKG